MTYELFQQGPAVYIPVLLLSLVITVVAYGAFPLIFAKARKLPITKKKYRWLCYGINIAVMFLFIAMNGGASSGAPYFLWTWVFSSWGTRILEGKGLLDDGTYTPSTPVSTPQQSNPVVVTDKVCFCRKCGEKLIDDSQFCRKCGTGIEIVSNSEPEVSKPINKEPPKTQQTTSRPTSPKSKKAPIIIVIVSAVAVCLIIALVVILIDNNKQPSQGEQPKQSEQAMQGEQTTYNVGVRTITFSDSAAAKSVLASWESGVKTEQSMIDIMDEHGASQGGGQLYIITPGDFVEGIDEWCFSENRKQGDYAIIENDYGYSLCYFSGRNMEESSSQKSDDTLLVAIEADFAPYSWIENGEYYGLHVDIAKEMAKRTGKTVSFVAVDFHELIAGVDSGLYDMAFGLEKTSERAEIVSFTGEYYDGMSAIYHTEGEEPTFSEWTVYTKILQDIVDDGTMKTLLAKYNLS